MERDEYGRFVKGNGGGPGRPPRAKEHDYLTIMLNIVTPKRWANIVAKATDQAERGDQQARKWLADYIVGEPEHNVTGNFVIKWEDNGAED
jgi:hypothetical protein